MNDGNDVRVVRQQALAKDREGVGLRVGVSQADGRGADDLDEHAFTFDEAVLGRPSDRSRVTIADDVPSLRHSV